MENFSETKKGGRPPLIRSPELRQIVSTACSGPNVSERTRQNKYYQIQAMRVLGLHLDEGKPQPYPWLWGEPNVPRPGDHRVRWTLLAELGRIEDEETLREVAARLCELKPTTGDALVMLRRFRRGGVKVGDALELANKIIATINDYTNSHAGLTREDMRAALRTVAGQLAEGEE